MIGLAPVCDAIFVSDTLPLTTEVGAAVPPPLPCTTAHRTLLPIAAVNPNVMDTVDALAGRAPLPIFPPRYVNVFGVCRFAAMPPRRHTEATHLKVSVSIAAAVCVSGIVPLGSK